MGIAERTLREHGLTDQAKEMKDRVFASGSYGEALCIIGEYVNITDTEPEQRPSLRQQLKETKTAEPAAAPAVLKTITRACLKHFTVTGLH